MNYEWNSILIEKINNNINKSIRVLFNEFENYCLWPSIINKIHLKLNICNVYYTNYFFEDKDWDYITREEMLRIDFWDWFDIKKFILENFEFVINRTLQGSYLDFSRIIFFINKEQVLDLPLNFFEYLFVWYLKPNFKDKNKIELKEKILIFLSKLLDTNKEIEIFFISSSIYDEILDAFE